MKKIIIMILVGLCLMSFAACSNPDVEAAAGDYELKTGAGSGVAFKDFAYCSIILSKNGEYTFEYMFSDDFILPDGETVDSYKETAKFDIKNDGATIEFSGTVLSGEHTYRGLTMNVKFKIFGKEFTGTFLKSTIG